MIKIGAVLFAIGVFLLLPFDEIVILAPLVFMYGLQVIPIYYAIVFGCFIVGAVLIGIHILPWLISHPIGIIVLIISVIIAVYIWVYSGVTL